MVSILQVPRLAIYFVPVDIYRKHQKCVVLPTLSRGVTWELYAVMKFVIQLRESPDLLGDPQRLHPQRFRLNKQN